MGKNSCFTELVPSGFDLIMEMTMGSEEKYVGKGGKNITGKYKEMEKTGKGGGRIRAIS